MVMPEVVEEKTKGPIDPHELLKALSSMLGPAGEISSTDEVDGIVRLMKGVNKLVSRCVYVNILKATTEESTLEKFISSGGWDLMFTWLQEAKTDNNFTFVRELLLVYQGLPVTLEHLKSNTCAKMIKQLSKTDDEDMRTLATDIVNMWMQKIREKTHLESSGAPEVAADKSRKKSKKSKSKSKDGDHVSRHGSGSSQSGSVDSNGRSNKHEDRTVAGHASSGSVDSNNSNTSSVPAGVSETVPKHRPKTAKTAPTRFRSTGLFEQEATLPPPRKKRTADSDKANNLKRISSTQMTTPPEKKARPVLTLAVPMSVSTTAKTNTSPTEANSKAKLAVASKGIKLIPIPEIYESSGFMDAITSTPSSTMRRKKKAGGTKPSTSPTSPTPPGKQPAVPSFYKDTLDTETEGDAAEGDCSEETCDTKAENQDVEMREASEDGKQEGSEVSEETEGSRDGSEVKELTEPLLKRKKKRKTVSWVDDTKLKTFHYFELDETERVNVNRLKDFAETKKHEMLMERQMMENVKRSGHDMAEKITWRRPSLTTGLPPSTLVPGFNSKERVIQLEREQGVLQTLFFTKDMIPDTPAEPDLETQPEPTEPKIIPLNEEGMIDPPPFNPATATVTAETPFTLSPELASLVASMTGGQPPSSQAPPQSQPPPSQGTVAANMERILSSLMTNNQSQGNNDELSRKLQQMLEPVHGQMQDIDGAGPPMAGHMPPNHMMHNMNMPRQGLLGNAPPGFNPMMVPPGGRPMMRPRGPVPPMFRGDGSDWNGMRMPGPGMPPMPGMPNMMRGPRGPHIRGLHMGPRGPPDNRPVCRHFATPSGCRFGNGCAFIHPGVNAPL
ncbi:Serine/threonine-protein phosphatase 1 regulatory subunit 10 [Lamellibrachia satsuma]|nr:Serine/threonine-protein phosphatase 1 regulatory subunit 10 [Lamellibrachia satsuma]